MATSRRGSSSDRDKVRARERTLGSQAPAGDGGRATSCRSGSRETRWSGSLCNRPVLFVDNINKGVSTEDVEMLIKEFANVHHLFISRKERRNNQLAFALVELGDLTQVDAAAKGIHGKWFRGNRLFAGRAKYPWGFRAPNGKESCPAAQADTTLFASVNSGPSVIVENVQIVLDNPHLELQIEHLGGKAGGLNSRPFIRVRIRSSDGPRAAGRDVFAGCGGSLAPCRLPMGNQLGSQIRLGAMNLDGERALPLSPVNPGERVSLVGSGQHVQPMQGASSFILPQDPKSVGWVGAVETGSRVPTPIREPLDERGLAQNPIAEEIARIDRVGPSEGEQMEEGEDGEDLRALFEDPVFPPGFEPGGGTPGLVVDPDEAYVKEEARQTLKLAKKIGCSILDEGRALGNLEGIIREQRDSYR